MEVESSHDDEFCPKQIMVWFTGEHMKFTTKQIKHDTTDYSDANQDNWHSLEKESI